MSRGFDRVNAVFKDDFNLTEAISQTAESGYYFRNDTLAEAAANSLSKELSLLPIELEDRITNPINEGRPNEVKQQHRRGYFLYGDASVPAANRVVDLLVKVVRGKNHTFPELQDWFPNEIGYQQYRPDSDYISPHRDRRSDRLLSVTLTMVGEATIKIFEPRGAALDYSNLKQIDEFVTGNGSVMLLRAPGLGNGKRSIHEVLAPTIGVRSIINLRMRPDLLPGPDKLNNSPDN